MSLFGNNGPSYRRAVRSALLSVLRFVYAVMWFLLSPDLVQHLWGCKTED